MTDTTQTPRPADGGRIAFGAADDCERTLRTVLRVNAATSTITGLTMAAAPRLVDDLIGVEQPGPVRLVGLGLLLFAAAVGWLSTTNRHVLRQFTPGIVVGDVSWVVASVTTVVLGWYSAVGIGVVLAVAVVVDVFALLQFNAVRHLRKA